MTLEKCIETLNSYAKSARNIAKDCLNKDGRHKLIKTAEKYEQEAEWLKELQERRKLPEIIYCGECELKIECCRNIRSGGRKDDDFCSCGRRAERRTDDK